MAVIGAGVAGLACARVLNAAGHDVKVFDKGQRAPGGRVHTRTARQGRKQQGEKEEEEEAALTFDDGAQYFTARAQEFVQFVGECVAHGCVREWSPLRLAVIDLAGEVRLKEEEEEGKDDMMRRYVGCPTMQSMIPFLAKPVVSKTHQAVRVAQIQRQAQADASGWRLVSESGEDLGIFEALVVAIPPRQAADILPLDAAELRDRVASVHMHPCWALGVAFDTRQEALLFDGAFVNDKTLPLSWIARNSSKPSRPEKKDCWVLHGSAAWSTEHLEDDPQVVTKALLEGFKQAVGVIIDEPSFIGKAFRWRYAIPEKPLPERFIFDTDLHIGICGDWCGGPRIEGAFMSGHLLGQHMASALSAKL